MVQVTNKKSQTLHRMRRDPGSSVVFLLYRYDCRKRQSCNTINTHTDYTTAASGSPCQSGSNGNTNTYSDTTADTNAYNNTNSNTYAKTNTRSNTYAFADATTETNGSCLSSSK